MDAARDALRDLRLAARLVRARIFAVAYATYFGVRALTEGKVSQAVANAIDLVHVERKLDLDCAGLSGSVLGPTGLRTHPDSWHVTHRPITT